MSAFQTASAGASIVIVAIARWLSVMGFLPFILSTPIVRRSHCVLAARCAAGEN